MSVKKEHIESFIEYAFNECRRRDEPWFKEIEDYLRKMPTVGEEIEITINNSDELGWWNK